jgi:hypothetical protein
MDDRWQTLLTTIIDQPIAPDVRLERGDVFPQVRGSGRALLHCRTGSFQAATREQWDTNVLRDGGEYDSPAGLNPLSLLLYWSRRCD